MSLKAAEVESLLQTKFDFMPDQHRESGHRWYKLELPGLPVIRTFFSHGRGSLSADLEGKIARQLRVRKLYFIEMMVCTKAREDYYRQVTKDPFPPFSVRL